MTAGLVAVVGGAVALGITYVIGYAHGYHAKRVEHDAVRDLAEGWVGFDDSHYYGDAVLKTLRDAEPFAGEVSSW